MRPIDADELKKKLFYFDIEFHDGHHEIHYVYKQKDVDDAPTIELPERKTGRWIRHIRTDLGPKLNDTIECSECRIAFPTENMFRRSFCPNCGSYNGGKNDG